MSLAAIAVSVALVVAFFGLHAPAMRVGPSVENTEALASAMNRLASRPIEARISGSFAYRPLAVVRDGVHSQADDLQLTLAGARIAEMVTRDPTVENLHLLGAADLSLAKSDKAVSELEEALRKETNEEHASRGIRKSKQPALLADLSAAYIEQAIQQARIAPLVPALACAERASLLDPRSEVATWNRALALTALGDRDDALAAWDSFLKLDDSSPWAGEARRRRAALMKTRDEDAWPAQAARLRAAAAAGDNRTAREIVARFPTRSAGLVERELLPAWGQAVQKGEAEAAAGLLRVAKGIAVAIADVTRDSLLGEVLKPAADDRDLASAYASYAGLGAVFQRGGTAAAANELRRIRDGLLKARSPAAIRFTLALAYRLYEARNHAAALAELDSLDRGAVVERYPLSLAQYYWYRGLTEASTGRANQALQSYGEAVTLYRDIGDPGAAATLELMRADAADYAGDREQAWNSYGAAMRDIDAHGEARMLDIVMFAVARSALRQDYPDAAIILQTRRIERLRGTGNGAYFCQALIARCETNAQLGRVAEARADCSEGRRQFDALHDPATRDRIQADLDVASAEAESSAAASIAPLTSALEVSLKGNDPFRIARMYQARARALESLRDDAGAEADLRAGIARVDEQRAALSTDEFRISWLDSWRDLYANLVALLMRERRFEDALEVADASRARVALERTTAPDVAATVAALRQRLSPGAAFVEFSVAPDDSVIAWIVKSSGMSCREFAARGASRRIQACLRAFEMREAPHSPDSTPEALFDDLVRPWLADVKDSGTLFIAPDGPLAQLPYAALRDRVTGSRLLTSHTIVIEPSAAVFLSSRPRPAGPWTSALVVENPASDAARNLPELATGSEVTALRNALPATEILRSAQATPARFLELAPGHDIVHFAGHAIDDANGDGALVLAPDRSHPDGLLTGREIGKGSAPQGKLVVLAACRTSRGRISSEGALSLARSFLLTGSTAVVGSLWKVDDDASDRLFAAFYRQLTGNTSPAEALRRAQLELSATNPDPRYWAGFQVYGGT